MVDVNELHSHPAKPLFTHINGVIKNVEKITDGLEISKWAELVAIFHDLGKINPNFQRKVTGKRNKGYSSHAYFSAFVFYCFCYSNKENYSLIKKYMKNSVSVNELLALTVIIAKHHGHLPDFTTTNNDDFFRILSEDEIKKLFSFIEKEFQNLPIEGFIKSFNAFSNIKSFKGSVLKFEKQNKFLKQFILDTRKHKNPLDFFLNTQFAFATLLLADKVDASDSIVIDRDKEQVKKFCGIYSDTLEKYISKFQPTSELNKLRTEIRKESVSTIQSSLVNGKRVFELTAPTGSGKTVMLLSLASEIIKQKGEFRIMYALPFLSITEQVEKEVLKIFEEYSDENYVQRIDSKAINKQFAELQEKLDKEPIQEDFTELESLVFKEKTFSYPFVITTFVRFFETLLSNRNATLLKLPNFSKSIFLLDEIQSLPPRLYIFFVAYLTKFCKKFDSYAIISTATQPNFALPEDKHIESFFSDYEKPFHLLDYKKYFNSLVFNRYKINYQREGINIEQLAEKIIAENNSVLVILNTIDDSKKLYDTLINHFEEDEIHLLNTHFAPNDRKKKIEISKKRLRSNDKTVLISTQLIEAGVDISFPVLYRDFALVSSIIQAAGRCNRNGELRKNNKMGRVVLFNLQRKGKSRAKLIYGRGKDKEILGFTEKALSSETYQEKELLNVQKQFFDRIKDELNFAQHSQRKFNKEFDFVDDIQKCGFDKIGKFQLIDEQEYGTEMRYYVSPNDDDTAFESLLKLDAELKEIVKKSAKKDWNAINRRKIKIREQLKKMSNQIVQVRIKDDDNVPSLANDQDYHGLYHLYSGCYRFDTGIDLKGEDFII